MGIQCTLSRSLFVRLIPIGGLKGWWAWDLYGSSIAFAIRSVDRSLFSRLIPPYKEWWAVPTLQMYSLFARLIPAGGLNGWCAGNLYGSSIAFAIHSVDHSLSTRLILQKCARKKPSFEEKTRFRHA